MKKKRKETNNLKTKKTKMIQPPQNGLQWNFRGVYITYIYMYISLSVVRGR